MYDFSSASIDIVSIHRVGNKTNGSDLKLSEYPSDCSEKETEAMLRKYFLGAFQVPEHYRFTFSNDDHNVNPMFRFCNEVFAHDGNFHTASVHMAKHLYECSDHPMIKDGDLFFVYMSGLRSGPDIFDAIGIYKSESKESIIRLEDESKSIALKRLEGMSADKPDKACIVINHRNDDGFRICVYDRSSKGDEARYWKEKFLNIEPVADAFHHTKEVLDIARHFVTEQLTRDFEVNKSDQVDLLNRSMQYFKSHDSFVQEEFEEEVFRDPAVIDSFRKFDNDYKKEKDIAIEDGFDISLPAVKKQSRVYKSIIKLDRNFHIYIHGNKDLIVHGVDKDGRKYYKIYYENES